MTQSALLDPATASTPATAADGVNEAGGTAYRLPPKQALAQLAVTGCATRTFYTDARVQLDHVVDACLSVTTRFVAQTAIYARRHGRMKELPAVLCAYLAALDGPMLEQVFERVIDNGQMLRNFVRIVRSGEAGRQSLGSQPKRLVRTWLNEASNEQVIQAMVGQNPSLADVIKMAHPRAPSPARAALFGYLIGREVDTALLPEALRALERFKLDAKAPVPPVPFALLTGAPLSPSHWRAIARQASWTTTRLNLNTFARHGVFEDRSLLRQIAKRLRDPAQVRQSRVLPHQLLAACRAATRLPAEIVEALEAALDLALENVPKLSGSVAIAVDVSGSMASPASGERGGATSKVRCVDVAALMAAAIVKRNPRAIVLPFDEDVRDWRPERSVLASTESLAALLGGGTAVSAPLRALLDSGHAPDVTVIVSDNQSWQDWSADGDTQASRYWRRLRAINPGARLVCVDIQPYTHAQVVDSPAVMNIGGFSDDVFLAIDAFTRGQLSAAGWVDRIEAIAI